MGGTGAVWGVAAVLLLLAAGSACLADAPPHANAVVPLTDISPQWRETLASRGLTFTFGVTQLYQQNLHGGLSTHRRSGRLAGSYGLGLTFDLEKMLGVPGAAIDVLAEGAWSEGINGPSVGSLFGVNFDAYGHRAIDVTQLYWEQRLLDDRVKIRLGKLWMFGVFVCQDCPVAFDGNSYANNETTQFLNGGLRNNPTVPWPSAGLAAVVYVEPMDGWYVAGGVQDAEGDSRTTGFSTTFDGDSNLFYIVETGVVPRIPSQKGPLQGAYRVGFWYDHQPKTRFDGGTEDTELGFYLSANQMVWKENDLTDDRQGLGLFFRYGQASGDVRAIHRFWSVGAQYQGLIPGRDGDVVGIGFAQGRLTRKAAFTTSHESVVEAYYNVKVTRWLNISPSVQYVRNPGGNSAVDDAVVAALRAQLNF